MLLCSKLEVNTKNLPLSPEECSRGLLLRICFELYDRTVQLSSFQLNFVSTHSGRPIHPVSQEFFSVAFEKAPILVSLTTVLSRPFNEDSRALPLSMPLPSRMV